MALIKCPECGKEISDKALSCPNCGLPLASAIEKSEPPDVVAPRFVDPPQEEPPYQPMDLYPSQIEERAAQIREAKRRTRKKILLIIFVILFLAVGVFLLFVVGRQSNRNESGGTTTNTVPQQPVKNSANRSVVYISDRTLQYNAADDNYTVFFGLSDADKEYMSSSGTALIVITDNTGNELYNRTIPFSENDFTDWNNSARDQSRYLCGLYIPRSDIAGAATSDGVLSLTVNLPDGSEFSEENIPIHQLKPKAVSISCPSLPYKVYNYNYKNVLEEVIEVESIRIDTSTYSNGSSVNIFVTAKMLERYTDNTGSSSEVNYKLKNSQGVVIKSGCLYYKAMRIGENAQEQIYAGGLDINDSYSLVFENDVP